MAFYADRDSFFVAAVRKTGFEEPGPDNSRRRLPEGHLAREPFEGAGLYVDSHFKETSAAVFRERLECPAERIFGRLKQSASAFGQLTVQEMIPEREETQRRMFNGLRFALKEGQRGAGVPIYQEEPFFKRHTPKEREEGKRREGKEGSEESGPRDGEGERVTPLRDFPGENFQEGTG